MKEKTTIRERNVDLKGFFKGLISSEPIEPTQEEIILNNPELTPEEKKLLIGSLSKNDKLAHKLFANNIKAVKHINLKCNEKPVNIKIDEKVIQKSRDTQKEIEE